MCWSFRVIVHLFGFGLSNFALILYKRVLGTQAQYEFTCWTAYLGIHICLTLTGFELWVLRCCQDCLGFLIDFGGESYGEVVGSVGVHLYFCVETSWCCYFGIHFHTYVLFCFLALDGSLFVELFSFFCHFYLGCLTYAFDNHSRISLELSWLEIGIIDVV